MDHSGPSSVPTPDPHPPTTAAHEENETNSVTPTSYTVPHEVTEAPQNNTGDEVPVMNEDDPPIADGEVDDDVSVDNEEDAVREEDKIDLEQEDNVEQEVDPEQEVAVQDDVDEEIEIETLDDTDYDSDFDTFNTTQSEDYNDESSDESSDTPVEYIDTLVNQTEPPTVPEQNITPERTEGPVKNTTEPVLPKTTESSPQNDTDYPKQQETVPNQEFLTDKGIVTSERPWKPTHFKSGTDTPRSDEAYFGGEYNYDQVTLPEML